jgi:excisionase family DNA binding protein
VTSARLPDWIPQRLMTAKEVAELLQLSVRQIRRLIAHGQLEAISVGRSARIRPEALASLLDQQ